jgi:hypothetical protein
MSTIAQTFAAKGEKREKCFPALDSKQLGIEDIEWHSHVHRNRLCGKLIA